MARKREREPLILSGTYVMEGGVKVPVNPKEDLKQVDRFGAASKTIETGQLYKVVSA